MTDVIYLARLIEVPTTDGATRKAWLVGHVVVMKIPRKARKEERRWMVFDPCPDNWLAETTDRREAFRLAAERASDHGYAP